jgi:outer membrane protein W
VDVKKIFVESDASIDEAVLKSRVNLDPWVLSLGFGRKF